MIPPYGLSLLKPSPLWPPPPEEMTQRVHSTLRERVMQLTGARQHGASASVDGGATGAEADWYTPAGLRKGRKSWRRRLSLGMLRDASPEAADREEDVRAAAVAEDGAGVVDCCGCGAGTLGAGRARCMRGEGYGVDWGVNWGGADVG